METKELTYKKITRNFSISVLTETKLKEPYLSIYNYLNNIFKDLSIYDSDGITYFITNNKPQVVFTYQRKYNIIHVSNLIYGDLNTYKLSDNNIQKLFHWYFNTYCNFSIVKDNVNRFNFMDAEDFIKNNKNIVYISKENFSMRNI